MHSGSPWSAGERVLGTGSGGHVEGMLPRILGLHCPGPVQPGPNGDLDGESRGDEGRVLGSGCGSSFAVRDRDFSRLPAAGVPPWGYQAIKRSIGVDLSSGLGQKKIFQNRAHTRVPGQRSWVRGPWGLDAPYPSGSDSAGLGSKIRYPPSRISRVEKMSGPPVYALRTRGISTPLPPCVGQWLASTGVKPKRTRCKATRAPCREARKIISTKLGPGLH